MFKNIFIALLMFPFWVHAQNTYVKTVGSYHSDFGTSCKMTNDKGTIMTLCTSTNGIDFHIGLVKSDYNGVTQWTKLFQASVWCYPQTVLQTPDSGYMIFGMATDSLSLNGRTPMAVCCPNRRGARSPSVPAADVRRMSLRFILIS